MEINGVSSYRNRSSPSERFLSMFSKSEPENPNGDSISSIVGDELDEDDVFWTGDFSESNQRKPNPTPPPAVTSSRNHHLSRPENSGILAVLPEEGVKRNPGESPIVYRKALFTPSSSSSRMIPTIPKKKPLEYSMSVPNGKFQYHQSLPVDVPMRPPKPRTDEFDVQVEETEEEMLPPHEMVDRERKKSETFSVLEGAGRTLKGRDLRQVRNAVWRKTGFID